MQELPYFLQLVKGNIILYTIITTGSFADVDFTSIEHNFLSSQAVELRNFTLGKNEKFKSVEISLTELGTIITFNVDNDRYFENTPYYFGKDDVVTEKTPFNINSSNSITKEKSFDFPEFKPPLNLSIRNSSSYGHVVVLHFFRKNLKEILENKNN